MALGRTARAPVAEDLLAARELFPGLAGSLRETGGKLKARSRRRRSAGRKRKGAVPRGLAGSRQEEESEATAD
jgi:hypothetical protein